MDDERFKHIATDVRYRKLHRKDQKVKIDKRFQGMFTDPKFQLKYSVDQRGRPVSLTQADNFRKYYDLSSGSCSDAEDESGDKSESESELDENEEPKVQSRPGGSEETFIENENGEETQLSVAELNAENEAIAKVDYKLVKSMDQVHKNRMSEAVKEKLKDLSVDYARGIGMVDSESSSDESSSDDSEMDVIHPWGELDKDAEETEEVTKRLAICNQDWDRIEAKDLMVLLSSFLPADGIIESVTIYPSEFGLERMREEDLRGPKEIVDDENMQKFEDDDFTDKHSDGSQYRMEKLREYQLNRLKYYYAVVVCNSAEAAEILYKECDGLEYESTATKIDMRFIPDNMKFDQKPREACTTLPDVTKYKPRNFANSALQQGTVTSTWDETDPNRIEFNRKIKAGVEFEDDDLKAYIAASSPSESDGEENEPSEKPSTSDITDPIDKYKALLADIHREEEKKKRDVEMEVTWGVGLGSDNSSDSGDEIKPAKSSQKMSKKQKNKNVHNSSSSEDESTFRGKKKGKKFSGEDKEPEEVNNADLELLLADDDLTENKKSHFSMKQIVKEEKLSGRKNWKKKLKMKKENKLKAEDDFKVDVNDERFSAMYTSHLYNIDPADPHFCKTKGVDQFIQEKQRRRQFASSKQDFDIHSTKKSKLNPELENLVRNVKRKAMK